LHSIARQVTEVRGEVKVKISGRLSVSLTLHYVVDNYIAAVLANKDVPVYILIFTTINFLLKVHSVYPCLTYA